MIPETLLTATPEYFFMPVGYSQTPRGGFSDLEDAKKAAEAFSATNGVAVRLFLLLNTVSPKPREVEWGDGLV